MSFYNVAFLPQATNKLWVPQWDVDEELSLNKEEDEYLTRLAAIANAKAPNPIGVREGDRNLAMGHNGGDSGSEFEEEYEEEEEEIEEPSPVASASFDEEEFSD